MSRKNYHVNAYAREAAHARTCVLLKNIRGGNFHDFMENNEI